MLTKKEQINLCFQNIHSFCETYKYDEETKKLLNKFLSNYMQIRRVPTTMELDLKLEKLHELSNSDSVLAQKVIKRAIESGWASFYPVNSFNGGRQVDNIPSNGKVQRKRSSSDVKLSDEQF
jgi:hypothetical protein